MARARGFFGEKSMPPKFCASESTQKYFQRKFTVRVRGSTIVMTPEYGLIGKARIPNHKRAKYREIADGLTSENLMTPKGIELLRFFHKHGMSQVVRLPRPVLEFAAA